MLRALVCAFDNHRWVALSNLPLCGKVRARCDRCGRVQFVRTR